MSMRPMRDPGEDPRAEIDQAAAEMQADLDELDEETRQAFMDQAFMDQEEWDAWAEHESDLRDWDDLLLDAAEQEAEAWQSQWDDDPSPYSGDYSEE
jgi:hypothetical protein